MNKAQRDMMTKSKQTSFTEKLIGFRNYKGEDQIITYAEIQDEIEQHEEVIKI